MNTDLVWRLSYLGIALPAYYNNARFCLSCFLDLVDVKNLTIFFEILNEVVDWEIHCDWVTVERRFIFELRSDSNFSSCSMKRQIQIVNLKAITTNQKFLHFEILEQKDGRRNLKSGESENRHEK